jgi:molecular chaperone GrpE (heat shock protein)
VDSTILIIAGAVVNILLAICAYFIIDKLATFKADIKELYNKHGQLRDKFEEYKERSNDKREEIIREMLGD